LEKWLHQSEKRECRHPVEIGLLTRIRWASLEMRMEPSWFHASSELWW
jgi:hypothetical protein